MLFNSFVFIFLFLPLTFAAYFGLNRAGCHRVAKGVLVVASLYFYAFFNPSYLPIIVASIIVNYGLSYAMTNQASGITPPSGIAAIR